MRAHRLQDGFELSSLSVHTSGLPLLHPGDVCKPRAAESQLFSNSWSLHLKFV